MCFPSKVTDKDIDTENPYNEVTVLDFDKTIDIADELVRNQLQLHSLVRANDLLVLVVGLSRYCLFNLLWEARSSLYP